MQEPLPASVEQRDEAEGTRYVLPRRAPGGARVVGFVLSGFGLFVTLFMVFWMQMPIRSGLETDGPMRWFLLGFGLLGLPGLLMGLAMLASGFLLALNLSHAEILVTRSHLCAIERVGPFRVRRRRRTHDLRRFVVGKYTAPRSGQAAATRAGPRVDALRAEGDDGKPLWLAPGYDPATLRALGRALSSRILRDRPAGLVSPAAPALVVEESADGPPPPTDPEVQQPSSSNATFSELPDGFVVQFPARGVWKGSKGFLTFGIFWNAFVLFFILMMLHGTPSSSDLPLWLFLSLFLAIGIWMVVYGVSLGRRRLLLAVRDDLLAFRSAGLLRTRERRTPTAAVRRVVMAPSGIEVNDVPVMELRVELEAGKPWRLLRHRDDPEIAWVAWLLRNRLGLPAPPA